MEFAVAYHPMFGSTLTVQCWGLETMTLTLLWQHCKRKAVKLSGLTKESKHKVCVPFHTDK